MTIKFTPGRVCQGLVKYKIDRPHIKNQQQQSARTINNNSKKATPGRAPQRQGGGRQASDRLEPQCGRGTESG